MVTSSVMTQSGVGVDLPKASQETSEAQPEGVVVTLMPGFKILVNQKEVDQGNWNLMEKLVREALTQSKSKLVILEGDRQAFLGSVMEVMDHSRKAGAERFAIATATGEKN
jgi:biopolymer transport protein ExbD